jgi:dephospho-CoA kinase
MQSERLMGRDGINQTQAKAKMDSQMSIEQKKTLAHHVIDNSFTLAESRKQTEFLMRELTPSSISVLLMWLILFWPAVWLYLFLELYSIVDRGMNVGFIRRKPIPRGR